MRTKVLGANQRIKIGVEYSLGNAEKVLARVLRTVGLTLEVDLQGERFALYAARRVVTHDVIAANPPSAPKVAKPESEPISGDAHA